jgi:hypothetical protein
MAGAPDQMSAAINEKPLGRLGRADEVAVAVLWMRSTGASLMIGHASANEPQGDHGERRLRARGW